MCDFIHRNHSSEDHRSAVPSSYLLLGVPDILEKLPTSDLYWNFLLKVINVWVTKIVHLILIFWKVMGWGSVFVPGTSNGDLWWRRLGLWMAVAGTFNGGYSSITWGANIGGPITIWNVRFKQEKIKYPLPFVVLRLVWGKGFKNESMLPRLHFQRGLMEILNENKYYFEQNKEPFVLSCFQNLTEEFFFCPKGQMVVLYEHTMNAPMCNKASIWTSEREVQWSVSVRP